MSTIRTVWFLGLTLAAAAASGCVMGGDDDGAFVVTWELQYVGPERERISCDFAGTTTVLLETRSVRTGQVFQDRFDCRSNGGRSQTLPPGTYEVTLSVLSREGRALSALSGRFDLFRRDLTDLGHIEFKVQSFRVVWSLVRGNMPVTCEQAGATQVKLVTQLADEAPQAYTFPCPDRTGQTVGVPTGPYTAQVQLLGAGGQILSQTRPMALPVGGDRRADVVVTFDL